MKYNIELEHNETGESYVIVEINKIDKTPLEYLIKVIRQFPEAEPVDYKFSYVEGHRSYKTENIYCAYEEQIKQLSNYKHLPNEEKEELLSSIVTEACSGNVHKNRMDFFMNIPYIEKELKNMFA